MYSWPGLLKFNVDELIHSGLIGGSSGHLALTLELLFCLSWLSSFWKYKYE